MKFSFVAILIIGSVVLSSIGSQQKGITLKDDLLVYLTFEKIGGEIVFDESGNHHNGALVCISEKCEPPRIVEGIEGSAVKFDGNDDCVKLDNIKFEDSEPWTLSAWVKPIRSDNIFMFAFGPDEHNSSGVIFKRNKKKIVGIRLDGSYFLVNDINNYFNKFHHYSFVANGLGNIKLYIDGNLIDQVNNISTGINFNNIGNAYDLYNHQFEGVIDNIRLYSRQLSKSEIFRLYNVNSW